MANTSISARPEHAPNPFHLAARAARKAARQWFAGIPTQSLAVWRDERCKAHCDGLPLLDMRSRAFNYAFAREVGQLIIACGHSTFASVPNGNSATTADYVLKGISHD